MAYFFDEPSHTFDEYLLIPGYTSADCVPANVSLRTPIVRYNKKSGEKCPLHMNIPMVSAVMQSVSNDKLKMLRKVRNACGRNRHPAETLKTHG